MTLPEIISGVNGTEADVQMQATQAARKLLSKERNPPIDDIIQAGIIPRLVEFLSHNDRYIVCHFKITFIDKIARLAYLFFLAFRKWVAVSLRCFLNLFGYLEFGLP